jgi:hypothetical protein
MLKKLKKNFSHKNSGFGLKESSQPKGVKLKIIGRKLRSGLSILAKGLKSKKRRKTSGGVKQGLCLFLPFMLDYLYWFDRFMDLDIIPFCV